MPGRFLRVPFTVALPLVALAAVGCSRSTETGASDAPTNPVLLIGVDGLEWSVVLEMLEEGRLPNLLRLMEGGVWGECETFTPAMSPVIWTSVATGVGPDKHGIASFVRKGEDWDRRPESSSLYTSADRRVKALWNILSAAGKRSIVIGWWTTYPAEEIEGVMVAQTSTLEPDRIMIDQPRIKGGLIPGLSGQIHPPEREAELFATLDEVAEELPDLSRSIFGDFEERLDPLGRKLWEGCLWSLRSDATYQKTAIRLMGEAEPFELCLVYLSGADVFGHRFWRYAYPEEFAVAPSAEELEVLGGFLKAYYAHVDALVGELVARAPSDCNVIILSDHGMLPGKTNRISFSAGVPLRMLLSGQHDEGPPAFFVLKGPDIAGSDAPGTGLARSEVPRLGSVLDVTPTILALLGMPVGRDMDGRVLEELLTPTFRASHPLRFVDTYTPPGWYEGRHRDDNEIPWAEERIEQLRALGYLE